MYPLTISELKQLYAKGELQKIAIGSPRLRDKTGVPNADVYFIDFKQRKIFAKWGRKFVFAPYRNLYTGELVYKIGNIVYITHISTQ